uniref:Uncharacterized protein n=1 Tax=Solanum tuberosum TaxID=4113 RepID=M1E065_SOLTU
MQFVGASGSRSTIDGVLVINEGATDGVMIDDPAVSPLDEIDDAVASVSEVFRMVEPLAAILSNYDEEEVQGYDEVLAALSGLGSYSKNPLKLDIDLKN